MTVGRITFGPAEPYSAPILRRRGSDRGFGPAALTPKPSPEINPPRDIAPVHEWRVVPLLSALFVTPNFEADKRAWSDPKKWPMETK